MVYSLGAFEDDTCDLQPRSERQIGFDLVFTLHHQDIRKIDA
jgi:hypothetical protein